jgi:hypothetical protein
MQPKQAQQKPSKIARNKAKQTAARAPRTPLSKGERKALSKIEHVRSELSSLYRQSKSGQIPIANASRLAYMLGLLAGIIKDSTIEERMTNIETLLQQGLGS